MTTKRKIKNLRVVYLAMETSGRITCRWKDGAIPNRADYLSTANELIVELSAGDPSGPGTGTSLTVMEYKKPTRILYYLAMDDWSFTDGGHRFNPNKPGCSDVDDTYSDVELLDFDRAAQGVTVINANENRGKPVGEIQKYGYDLVVKTTDGLVIIIDPEDDNDGTGPIG